MMTLDEAINHAEEVEVNNCSAACRDDHKNLALWLRELKQLRSEVSRLTAERDELLGARELDRCAIKNLKQERDALQEQVKMLLDHKAELTAYLLEIQACSASFHINGLVNKALAATEPKE